MQKKFDYPEILKNKRINDTDIANAYDSLTSLERAHIKNGIAFNHFLYKESSNEHQITVNDNSKGYMYSLKTKPVTWTVLFFTHKYSSAPRMIAALMPAILAKVPLILAISLDGLPSNNALTALELMGIEDIFCMNNTTQISKFNDSLNIINSMHEFDPNGKVLLFHNNELSTIIQSAIEHNIAFWQENKPPKIAIQNNLYTKEYLSWAHADTLYSDANIKDNNVDALFCSQEFYEANKNTLANIKLSLFEGMEGCWVHSNLNLEFFQQTIITAKILELREENLF